MYDFLLFVHVLSAFMLVAMVVMYSAYAVGGPTSPRSLVVAQIFDGVGGAGTLIFGVWLAIYLDGYGLFDGWILAAIVLWMLAAETGRRTHAALIAEPGATPAGGGGATATATAVDQAMVRWHLIRTVITVLLLLDMVVKPGA